MASMAALLAWALVLLPAFASAQTQKGFWDYLSQSSRDKGKEEQLQRQKLAWEPTSLKDSLEQDLSNIDKLLETLGPLRGQAREPPARRLDAAAVRQQLQEQLAEVRARLEPHMAEAHEQVRRNLEALRRRLQPYAADPHAAASPARLRRCVQTLSHKLTLKAEALHARIQRNLDQLREELSAFDGARADGAVEGTSRDPQGLSQEVHQRLQAFRHNTFLQIADFTRAIDRETEEVQLQLAPPPPGHSAFAPELLQADSGKALSKLQARLEDLWEDINYSLHDHDLSHQEEP
ncbi:apolipoprotein A-V [Suricata suricatta]|uniref:apolipoprotein A-V n=1 Tax=Suricata suricatta TaxID=37032 RepID=UPI001156B5A9|nr:apolipoprotein A-V [Suricata suricatta]